jgi:hypothetical protein
VTSVETPRLQLYVRETCTQCGAALFAFSQIKHVLKSRPQDISALAFFYVHAMLAHSANVSKLLFPGPPGKRGCTRIWWGGRQPRESSSSAQRAKCLRKALLVNKHSPLRKRVVRNHFEHYDERLDKLFEAGDAVSVADMNVTTGRAISVPGMHGLRNLDAVTMVVSFEGDEVELEALHNELERVKAAAQQWLDSST